MREAEHDAESLVGSMITSVDFKDGYMVIQCGKLEMKIGSDGPIWCVFKEYTVQ